MQKLSISIIFIFLFVSLNSCKVGDTYELTSNNGNSSDWIQLNNDNTFEYAHLVHIGGFSYVKGEWKVKNDTLILSQFEEKPPLRNKIIELKDSNNSIQIFDKKNETLIINRLTINENRDTIFTDIDGLYKYSKKFKGIERIKVYELEPENVLIADFKTNCNNCSYKIIVDYDKIAKRLFIPLPDKWLLTNGKLKPLNNPYFDTEKDIFIKSDSKIFKRYNGWQKWSYKRMKNGYE